MIWNDEYGFYMNMIKEHPEYMKKFDEKYLDIHPEKITECININPKVIGYLSEKYLNNYENLIEETVNKYPEILKCLPVKYRNEHINLCLDAVEKDLNNIQYLPMKARSEEICLKAVNSNYNNIRYVPEEFQINHIDICKQAIKINLDNIYYVSEEILEKNIDICEYVLKKDVRKIEDIPENILEKNPKLYEIALSQNIDVIDILSDEIFINNPNLYEYILKKDVRKIEDIPKNILEKNPKLYEIAIEKGEYLSNLPQEINNNNPELYWKNELLKPISLEEFDAMNWKLTLPANGRNSIIRRFQEMKCAVNLKKVPREILEKYPDLEYFALDIDYGVAFKSGNGNYLLLYKDSYFKQYFNVNEYNGEYNEKMVDLFIKFGSIRDLEIYYDGYFSGRVDKLYIIRKIVELNPELLLKPNSNFRNFERILVQNSELCMEAVRKCDDCIFLIPKKIQRENIEELTEVFGRIENFDDKKSIKYIISEILEKNPEQCINAVKQRQSIKYIPLKIKNEYYEINELAEENSFSEIGDTSDEYKLNNIGRWCNILESKPNSIKYFSKEIVNKNKELFIEVSLKLLNNQVLNYNTIPLDVKVICPELAIEVVKLSVNNFYMVPELLQEQHPEICRLALEMDKSVFFSSDFYARDNEEVQKLIYGKDNDRINRIKQNNYLKLSSNYNECIMEKFYYNMVNSIGIDNMERLFRVPEFSEEQVKQYSLENINLFQENFETKYSIIGEYELVFNLIKKYPIARLYLKRKKCSI